MQRLKKTPRQQSGENRPLVQNRGAKMDLKKIFDNFVTKSRRLGRFPVGRLNGAESEWATSKTFFVEVRAPIINGPSNWVTGLTTRINLW